MTTQPSKRKRNREAFCVLLLIVLILLPLVLLVCLSALSADDRSGLKQIAAILLPIYVFLFLFSFIGLITTFFKPFIECTEIGIDAHGKRYKVANDSNWFFSNLSSKQIKRISERVLELEAWREKKLASIKTDKGKTRFIKKFNEKSQCAFYCYIYRSGTRYTQKYYVKTPYIGTSEYWGQYYSLEEIKAELCL